MNAISSIQPAEPDEQDDGSEVVDLTPQGIGDADDLSGLAHDANLADALPDSVLARIAEEVVEGFEADWESNAPYRAVLDEGMKLLGLEPGKRIDLPFPGAFGGCDPGMMEAVVSFWANASSELLPADGPARMEIAGDVAPGEEAVAQRKEAYMNFHLTKRDAGWRADASQGIMLTGAHGSTFKKVFRDPRRGYPISRTLTAYDLVVTATAASIEDAGRVTQVERDVSQAEMRRLQIAGYYSDVDLAQPSSTDEQNAKPDGQRTRSDRPEDASYELLHQYVLLDIEGLEHVDDDEPTGLPLPYVVTVERESRQVIRLVRNYKEDDQLFLPCEHFSHSQYMPGFGFYGMGLFHLVGQSADAATTMLRQAVNAFTLASFPGGFRVRGVKSEKSTDSIGPCQFIEIDTGGMPIGNAVMPLPYKDVPPSFASLFEAVKQGGQRLGSTADMAVGDGRPDAPVGTTIALIEKATRLESAAVKGLHHAQAKELRMLADLFGKEDGGTYPYLVNGQRGVAYAKDFQTNDDIVPVSDPNAPTRTQRLALAEGKLNLGKSAPPGMFDVRALYENMFRTLGSNDQEITTLMPPPQAAFSGDPISELQAALSGKPIQPRPDQDHAAHLAIHATQINMPGVAKTPVAAMLAAHLSDHLGMLVRAQAGLQLGHPLPPAGPLPPQIEAALTQDVARVAQSVAAAMPGAAGDATKPDIGPIEAQLKRDELAAKQADSDRKALIAAKADQIKIATTNVTSQDEEANRQQAQRNNATKVAVALMGMQNQQTQAQHGIAQTAVDGTAEIMAEAQRQSGQALQNRHDAGMQLLQTITEAANHSHASDQLGAEHAEAAKQRTHDVRMKKPE